MLIREYQQQKKGIIVNTRIELGFQIQWAGVHGEENLWKNQEISENLKGC